MPVSLEPLLDLAAQDEASGLGDATSAPAFREEEGEAPRVAPSRAPNCAEEATRKDAPDQIANSPSKEAAFEGSGTMAGANPKARRTVAVEDALVDSMRGKLFHLDSVSGSICATCRRRCYRRRKHQIRTTIPTRVWRALRASRKHTD